MNPVGDQSPGGTPSGADGKRSGTGPVHHRGAATLRLPISQIHAYDRNPRQAENPEYERIKASIRVQGMDQPLAVTQRPGESAHMIFAGGNTRLRILQELYEETGEERFREVTCLYHPWTRETDVLVAHLRENDLRGDLCFLDKASAVREVKRLLEEEEGEGSVSQTRLTEALRDCGYALSQGLVSQMTYTVERLLPLLPTALRSGMGRPQVERIRQLERATRTLWLDRVVDREDEFDQAFAILCHRYDGPDWDIANLRRALEAEIAERADASIQAVSLALEAYLAGRRDSDAGVQWRTDTDDSDRSVAVSDAKGGLAAKTTEQSPAPASACVNGVDLPVSTDREDVPASGPPEIDARALGEGDTLALPNDDKAPSQNDRPSNLASVRMPTDLKSLRARAWTLASRLAQRNGLSELVQPLAGNGLGYLLSDVPDPALVDQLDEQTLAQVSMVWWYLAAAAEMTVAPVEHLLPALPQTSVLRRALEEQDAGLLFSSVWTLDPGHMGFRLWRRLDDRDWRDLVDLMETYRALHLAAETSGNPLWR